MGSAVQAMLLGTAAAAGGGGASVIQSIQTGTITITAGNASNTATISSVVTANSIVIFNGRTTTNTGSYENIGTRLALTNSTTVTATRGATSGAVTVAFTVVEFASGVNSIQAGTITISAGTSNTATISAVGANAFVLWLGSSTTNASSGFSDICSSVELTNSTTVTARIGTAINAVVSYMVVDLDSTIVASIQQRSLTSTAASGTDTDTITSVTTNRTLLFYNGSTRASAAGVVSTSGWRHALASSTSVTFDRSNTADTTSRTHRYTVVVFAAGALNTGVQRGSITLASQTSNTATISSLTTAKSFVNWNGLSAASANADTVNPRISLTNATTVTATVNTSGSPTVPFEVMEFA